MLLQHVECASQDTRQWRKAVLKSVFDGQHVWRRVLGPGIPNEVWVDSWSVIVEQEGVLGAVDISDSFEFEKRVLRVFLRVQIFDFLS